MAKSPYAKNAAKRSPRKTSQSKPIPGREKEMKQNLAGGYSFKADDWQAVRRWLLTGSMFDAYYQGKEQMTDANVKVLKAVMGEDPVRTAQEILDASKKGVSVHTPIYALTILSSGDTRAVKTFREVFPSVIRNASQLYEFMSYVKDVRGGFGSQVHKTLKDWIQNKKASELEYQFLKYQSRYDWSARDVLRIAKPIPADPSQAAIFNWAVGGTKKNPLMTEFPAELARLNAYEKLKKGANESDVIDAIQKYRMTWEMMPGNITMTDKIWEALFHQMPVGATIRNLGNLTDKNVFKKSANLDELEARFSKENLAKAYIHPIVFASAMKIYAAGGEGGKSKLRWSPIARVKDIMEDGIDRCFDAVEPTGLDYFFALDISSSMLGGSVGTMHMSPYEVEGIMALATVRSEKNYFVGGFNDRFVQINSFTKKMGYQKALNFWNGSFGGTDANQAYLYAMKNNIKTDVFVFFTDGESWAGYQHPAQGLKDYRSKLNKKAKAVYITLLPYGDTISLVDPKDKLSFDIAGFTSETPKLISLISKGEI